MSTQAETRDIRHIPRPRNSAEFEKMCVNIYLETYHSPGARRYGRSGEAQSGIDIIFADFRKHAPRSSQGLVFVQCKHSETNGPNFKSVLEDVKAAAELISSSHRYQGIYLFILATSGENSVKLHDKLEDLKLAAGGKFEVELHTWDKLCNFIQSNDKLWELYSEMPSGQIPPQFRLKVHEYVVELNALVNDHRLKDARQVNWERANQNHSSAFGSNGMRPPVDIWQTSPELRFSLVRLFTGAADGRAAVDMLEYEFSAGRMKDAGACLSYLLAYRIVGNLRAQDNRFPLVGDKPVFSKKLERLADTILNVQGGPDSIASLALILIMETEDKSIHDRAMMMVHDMVDAAQGMRWEVVARIALCIVRFYYVRRHGWTALVRSYELGDTYQAYVNEEVTLDSPLLGQPFPPEETDGLTVLGVDPLSKPWEIMNGVTPIFSNGFRKYRKWYNGFNLKTLAQQCVIYSAPVYQTYGRFGPSVNMDFLAKRVIDHRSIFIASFKGQLRDLANSHILMTTERSYERLLGYRAVLQAYAKRNNSQDPTLLHLIKAAEEAIGWSQAHDAPKDIGLLWVVPVYDNPPPKPDDLDEPGKYGSPFTIKSNLLADTRRILYSGQLNSEAKYDLRCRYRDRTNPFSLSCMLALSSHSPMITYFWEDATNAELMGIGVRHPEQGAVRY